MKRCCLGVLREPQNSPNRETDDARILETVLAKLENYGISTRLATPEQFDAEDMENWDLLIPMCESYARLKRLECLKRPTLLVNRPQAALNCYRIRMAAILSNNPAVTFPPTIIRPVEDRSGYLPREFEASYGWWLKRGDVHNTCEHDVVRIRDWSEVKKVLQDFQSREITHYVVQPHIPGDVIKFYGVGPGRWSTWFYHSPEQIVGFPFEAGDLARAASASAAALGLEIFGGDAIVSARKKITIIDINSWPSFSKVRSTAAHHIAGHLSARLRQKESIS